MAALLPGIALNTGMDCWVRNRARRKKCKMNGGKENNQLSGVRSIGHDALQSR